MNLQRFRKWMRVVFAPEWILWGALACLLCAWAIECLLRLSVPWMARAAAPNVPDSELYFIEIPAFHQSVVLGIAGIYGFLRGLLTHPIFNRSYGIWLAQTPWRPWLPLPLSPIELVWQDAVALLAMMAIACLPPWSKIGPWHIPAAFLFAYCITQALALKQMGLYRSVCVALFIGALAVFVGRSPVALFAVALASYGYFYLETRRSLRDFPFTESRRRELGLVPYEIPRRFHVGLPLASSEDGLAGLESTHFMNRHALLIASAIGLIFLAFAFQFHRDSIDYNRGLLVVHRLISLIVIGWRTFAYCVGHWPPLSVRGRIAVRRWIVPGYDKVLIAPATGLAAAVLLPKLLLWVGISPMIAWPLSTATVIWLCFGLRPTLMEWHYTGHHRIPTGWPGGKLQNFVKT